MLSSETADVSLMMDFLKTAVLAALAYTASIGPLTPFELRLAALSEMLSPLANPMASSGSPRAPSSAVVTLARPAIRYDIRLDGVGSVKKARYKLISKRNSVAFRNLKPGTYTTRYRVIKAASKGSPRTTTPFSPRQRVTVTRT